MATASTRFSAPSLRRMCLTCCLTVPSEMNSLAAIAALVRPLAMCSKNFAFARGEEPANRPKALTHRCGRFLVTTDRSQRIVTDTYGGLGTVAGYRLQCRAHRVQPLGGPRPAERQRQPVCVGGEHLAVDVVGVAALSVAVGMDQRHDTISGHDGSGDIGTATRGIGNRPVDSGFVLDVGDQPSLSTAHDLGLEQATHQRLGLLLSDPVDLGGPIRFVGDVDRVRDPDPVDDAGEDGPVESEPGDQLGGQLHQLGHGARRGVQPGERIAEPTSSTRGLRHCGVGTRQRA